MNEQECLSKMVAPGTRRPGKYREGVIQIHVTRMCDKSCFNCTQGSNLRHEGKPDFITLENFEMAVKSLKGYFGVVGVFGGNPATHPEFSSLCEIMRRYIPLEQSGIWSNNPITADNAKAMRSTFDPAVSNLNVHLDGQAFEMFKTYWPESRPFGLTEDSRHSPVYVAMKDVLKKSCDCEMDDTCLKCNNTRQVYDRELAYDLISKCDINQHWSAMMGQFRGELRAWFCEIAGAQAMLHQHEPDYPDTGVKFYPNGYEIRVSESEMANGLEKSPKWWELPMNYFAAQVEKHCHECGVPLKGYGELAQAKEGTEQVSPIHEGIYRVKGKGHRIELVTVREQLGKPLAKMTHYLQNSHV